MAEIWTFADEVSLRNTGKAVDMVLRRRDERRKSRPARGSEDGCDSQNTIWHITIFGGPTFGTFDLNVTVHAVKETLTFNFDDDLTKVATEFATHTQIANIANLTVTAGPFPNATMSIEFIGDLSSELIALPTASFSSLTGGSGRGVIVMMAQRGH